MEKNIKLTEISGDSEESKIFNGKFVELMVAVINMLDSDVCEVIIRKK